MFEQSFVEGRVRTNKGWTVIVSSCLQVGLLAAALVVPLVNPELLPRVAAQSIFLAAPAPPPPPPAPATPRATRAAARQFVDARLLMPTRVPDKPMLLIDEPAAVAHGPGVPGGIGLPGQGRGNVLDMLGTALAPPPPPAQPAPAARPDKPIDRIRVGGEVQDAFAVHKVIPVYPPIARQTRTEGKVVFQAIIGRDGSIRDLKVISGHPLLTQAALDAVRQWRYRPTLLNGEPVEVLTNIEVRFSLSR